MAAAKDSASDADVEARWYQALFEEDCVAVMKLLDSNPSLLKVGWESEPAREVGGRKRRERAGVTEKSSWKGRTALHVGASRGCVQLMMQVLRFCNLDDFNEVSKAYKSSLLYPTGGMGAPLKGGEGAQASTKRGAALDSAKTFKRPAGKLQKAASIKGDLVSAKSRPNQSDALSRHCLSDRDHRRLLLAKEGESGLDALAIAVLHGNPTVIDLLRYCAGKLNHVADSSHHHAKISIDDEEDAVEIFSNSETPENRERRKLLRQLTVAAVMACIEIVEPYWEPVSDDESEDEDGSADEDGSEDGEGSEGEDGSKDEDGSEGSGESEDDSDESEDDSVESTDGQKSDDEHPRFGPPPSTTMREAFDEYMDQEGDEMLLARAYEEYVLLHDTSKPTFLPEKAKDHAVLKEYFEHRDFNFLPPEEYLFHFLCTTETRSPLDMLETLWLAVRADQSYGDLWKFLWELKDGQGRPPFHVAIEESTEENVIVLDSLVDDQVALDFAMIAPDQAGRTPVHRAAMRGRRQAIWNILSTGGPEVIATCHAAWLQEKNENWGSDWGMSIAHGFPLKVPLAETPLLAALMNRNFSCAELLLQVWRKHKGDDMEYFTIYTELLTPPSDASVRQQCLAWEFAELACLVGAPLTFIELLADDLAAPRRREEELKIGFKARLLDIWQDDPAASGRSDDERPEVRSSSSLREHESKRVGPSPSLTEKDRKVAGASPSRREDERKAGDASPVLGHDDIKEGRSSSRHTEDKVEGGPPPSEKATLVKKHQWHPIHFAAFLGRYDVVKFLLDDPRCDPFVEDFEGNSALHHAMKVRELALGSHLQDYVNLEHYCLTKHHQASMAEDAILQANLIAERQGCINLLLQAGCDVFKTNRSKQIPYPAGNLMDNTFLSWWYEKQEREFSAARNNLNFATNAIAVTATLVATASYVGPLQPPLGYDSNHVQYSNAWVSVFIVCDTISFYLAIVAITFSLIPSLPMPQQAMLDEIHRTREMVIMAVGILLPSIFFVFVAFACSSISVMSGDITSEVGGIFVIITTLVGIVLCMFAFVLFSIRFLAFMFPKNNSIRRVYNISFVKKLFNSLLGRKTEAFVRERKKGPDLPQSMALPENPIH